VTTVLFPALSRLAALDDRPGFGRTLDAGLRQIAFLLVPAGAVCVVLAEPIVRLVYQRGAFDAVQTPVVAGALAAFGVGLVFNGWMLLLNRAFYSLQNSWIPTTVACINLALNVALYCILYRVGVWGIPLAVSIANLVAAALLFVLLRPRVDVAARPLAWSIVRIAGASAALAGGAYGTWWLLDALLGTELSAQIVAVGAALAVGAGVYVGACRILRVRELDALLRLRHGGDGA
jgi:putative peptidoglycan lipid II flippase